MKLRAFYFIHRCASSPKKEHNCQNIVIFFYLPVPTCIIFLYLYPQMLTLTHYKKQEFNKISKFSNIKTNNHQEFLRSTAI